MKIVTQATLLSAESKPYDISGNKGVSHKARFLVDGEIYKVNATESDVKSLQAVLEGDMVHGTLMIALTSPKENIKVSFVSFE